jgi:hypothetical protein
LNLEMKLEVWDSPNSAGIVIDAVRCAKLALDHGLKGALIAPSSYFKKSPPVQIPDDTARELVERYIKDPKGVERQMRIAPPILKRELPPAGKLARAPGAAKLQKATTPVARKAAAAGKPAAAPNGHPNGNGHAAAAAADTPPARGAKPDAQAAAKPGKRPRRAPARAR